MIVVTGGTGLVGAHLLYDLCLKHDRVRAIKRINSDINQVKKTFAYYSNDYENLFNKIEWLDGDIDDFYSLEEAFEGAEYVYHSAAMVSFRQEDDSRMQEVNVKGTANVVNAALYRNVKKLCHVSSIAALGHSEKGQLITEETPWKGFANRSAYSISKYNSELEVWRGIEEGLNAVIVNPSIILGPTKWDSGSARLFTQVYKGLNFYTLGTNGFVYVRDVSRAMIELTESKMNAQRFTLNSENISYQTLLNLIAINLGKTPPKIAVKPWMSELSWRLLKVYALLSGTEPLITKATARSSRQINLLSNQKIKETLNFNFVSTEEMIKISAQHFLADHESK
ncbi:MAG: NAD-dependent epimerase/dehydratase family protein [Bacteroidota bacterium]